MIKNPSLSISEVTQSHAATAEVPRTPVASSDWMTDVILVLFSGHACKGYSNINDMVALAWNSAPAKDVSDIAASTEKLKTWSLVAKAKEGDQRPQLVLKSMETTV